MNTMTGNRSHRLLLGLTTPGEVAAYIEAFLVAFSQGSGDAFGRLSKLRGELNSLLWTHPSGSQAGITDALEYLEQLLQKCYGISLKAGLDEESEASQPSASASGSDDRAAAALPNGTLHQGPHPRSSQMQPLSSGRETGDHMQPSSLMPVAPIAGPEEKETHGHADSAAPEQGHRSSHQDQGNSATGPAAKVTLEVPAVEAAAHKSEKDEAPRPEVANAGTQHTHGPPNQMHAREEVPNLAGQLPDSAAMDTCTLRELTVLPSAQGRIPVGVRSPLPAAAAQTGKSRGAGRVFGSGTRTVRPGQPPPARGAQQAGRARPAAGRARERAGQSPQLFARSTAITRVPRAPQPAARKQLHFAPEADAGKISFRVQSPRGNLAGKHTPVQHAAQQQGSQHARPHGESPRGAHMRQHGAASSDSDMPKSASARLPQPVQQAGAMFMLAAPPQESLKARGPAVQPAQGVSVGSSTAEQGASLLEKGAQQQGDAALAQGMGAWIAQLAAMGAAVAASASAAAAAGAPSAAANLQQGPDTHFNNCHFMQSMPSSLKAVEVTAPAANPGTQPKTAASSSSKTPAETHTAPGVAAQGEGDAAARKAMSITHVAAEDKQSDAADKGKTGAAPGPPGPGSKKAKQATKLRQLNAEPKPRVHFKPRTAKLGSWSNPQGRSVARRAEITDALTTKAPAAGLQLGKTPGKEERRVKSSQRRKAPDVEAEKAQPEPVFDFKRALAALDSQSTANLPQLHSTGSHSHEAAFQPLAELLLHPETLKHLESDSDVGEGAESGHLQRPSSVQAHAEAQQSAGEPAKAPQSSSSGNAADPSGASAEDGASTAHEDPSPAQIQMAERIADVVAARLSQAMQSAAGSPRLAPSNGHNPLLPDLPEEAEQAETAEPSEAATKDSLASTAEVAAPGHTCEEDFLAALLLGSIRSPRQSRHANSPGPMHSEACSAPGSKAANENAAACREPEPWSAQWVGRLSMDEIEAAVQEVIAEELQGMLKEWRGAPALLPQVCSHIACTSLEASQQQIASKSASSAAQQSDKQPQPDGTTQDDLPLRSATGLRRQRAEQSVAASAVAEGDIQGSDVVVSEAEKPIKEAFMHAVLQSLADICREGLHDGYQRPGQDNADSAAQTLGAERGPGRQQAAGNTDSIAEQKPIKSPAASRVQSQPQLEGGPETLPRPRAPGRQAALGSSQKAAQLSTRLPKRAATLTRLKAMLHKPKPPIVVPTAPAGPPSAVLAASQLALQPEEAPHEQSFESPAVGPSLRREESAFLGNAAQGKALASSLAAHSAEPCSSWQTAQGADSCSSVSRSMSGSEARRNGSYECISKAASTEAQSPATVITAMSAFRARAFAAAEPQEATGSSRGIRALHVSRALRMSKPEHQLLAASSTACAPELLKNQLPDVKSRQRQERRHRRHHRKPAKPHSQMSFTEPLSHSADETDQQYRRQKALAAERRNIGTAEARTPARREGTADRRRRLVAEGGLTDSLLFSSDSSSDSEVEMDCEPSHTTASSSSSSRSPEHLGGSEAALSSISSAASTPGTCLEPSTPERRCMAGSDITDMGTPSESKLGNAMGSRHRGTRSGALCRAGDDAGSSTCQSSSSRAYSTAGFTSQVSTEDQNGQARDDSSRHAVLQGGSAEGWWQRGTIYGSHATMQTSQLASWGASAHLQERLAMLRNVTSRIS